MARIGAVSLQLTPPILGCSEEEGRMSQVVRTGSLKVVML